jgi:hypothetical protein
MQHGDWKLKEFEECKGFGKVHYHFAKTTVALREISKEESEDSNQIVKGTLENIGECWTFVSGRVFETKFASKWTCKWWVKISPDDLSVEEEIDFDPTLLPCDQAADCADHNAYYGKRRRILSGQEDVDDVYPYAIPLPDLVVPDPVDPEEVFDAESLPMLDPDYVVEAEAEEDSQVPEL